MYQRQADDALAAAAGPSDDYWRALGPPLPQIEWLPDRFGYPAFVDRVPTIMSVFGIDRMPMAGIPGMPRMRGQDRVDYTKSQDRDQASPRNENVDALGMGGASW